MISETDAPSSTTSADASSAPGASPAGRPDYGRVTGPAGPGDTALAAGLQQVLDGHWAPAREHTRAALMPERGFPVEDGGQGDTGGVLTSFEMLGHLDLSVMVKAGVQWGLFGGAIANLGNAETRAKYLPDVMSLDLLGCFAMTELGQGSDVQNLETTATFDPETGEFVVHSPPPSSEKAYIGNAGRDGRLAAVFAQLITPGEDGEDVGHGVHCLLVPIRDASGEAMPGVTLTDHGHKGGLLGV